MNIDWNPIIEVLDELSDGTHSFFELSYMRPRYGAPVFLESLLFLADRGLVEVSVEREVSSLSKGEGSRLLREAFGAAGAESAVLAHASIDLTDKGEQVLRLLNIGHPPLSAT